MCACACFPACSVGRCHHEKAQYPAALDFYKRAVVVLEESGSQASLDLQVATCQPLSRVCNPCHASTLVTRQRGRLV